MVFTHQPSVIVFDPRHVTRPMFFCIRFDGFCCSWSSACVVFQHEVRHSLPRCCDVSSLLSFRGHAVSSAARVRFEQDAMLLNEKDGEHWENQHSIPMISSEWTWYGIFNLHYSQVDQSVPFCMDLSLKRLNSNMLSSATNNVHLWVSIYSIHSTCSIIGIAPPIYLFWFLRYGLAGYVERSINCYILASSSSSKECHSPPKQPAFRSSAVWFCTAFLESFLI